jgi:alkaline phosphatase D
MLNPAGCYDRVLARLSRRDLLKVAWVLGAGAIARSADARRLQGPPYFGSYPFSMGVASGDPLPTGIVLWTRLAPRPLEGGGMPMVTMPVQWELARDATFRTIVQKGDTLAHPELGHSVHVDVTGLEPARDYWYRFRAGNEVSQTGRTRTAPAAGADIDRLRFGVCGCSHYETGYFTGYRRIAQEQFDFVIHTGDYFYESRADGGRNEGRVRQHHGDEIYTLVDYRNRYGQYKSDPDLIAAHRSAPFIVSWDDHEVDNNYAGDLDEMGTPAPVFLLRRAAAYQAYYEHMPLRATSFPSGPHMRIYRRLQFGNLIDMSVLDTRQWRSDQACGDGLRNCPASLDPARTMLGAEQEKWVFGNLAEAKARWTVLSQQVYSFARDFVKVNPDARLNMDVWDGYPAARNRLYSRLKETRAPNPIVISGDVHLHYGADLKLDFANPKSDTVGVEFTNTSISAGGDGADVSATWEAVREANPHIRYHSARRGYIACTVTPATMHADFKVLDRVTVPDMPIRIGGSLVVEAGRAGSSPA